MVLLVLLVVVAVVVAAVAADSALTANIHDHRPKVNPNGQVN